MGIIGRQVLSFWGSVKCTFGSHDWSEWVYDHANACNQSRSCSRCGKKEEQVAHVHGSWSYTSPESCRMARKCSRCGNQETGVFIVGESGVTSERARVTKSELLPLQRRSLKDQHVLGVWEYESPTSCRQVRFCRRCQEKEIGEVIHKWGNWEPISQSAEVRRCSHCGSEENRSAA